MQIIAQCPKCHNSWRLNGGTADRRIRCRRCGALFKIPKLENVPEALQVIRQAKGEVYVDEGGKTFG